MGARREYIELGTRYGQWTIKKIEPLKDYAPTRYECICECGVKRIIAATTLRAGKSTQCGKCANSRWRKICNKCRGDIDDKTMSK